MQVGIPGDIGGAVEESTRKYRFIAVCKECGIAFYVYTNNVEILNKLDDLMDTGCPVCGGARERGTLLLTDIERQ